MTSSKINANRKIELVLSKILEQHYLGTENNNIIILNLDNLTKDTNMEYLEVTKILSHLNERKIIKHIDYQFNNLIKGEEIDDNCYLSVSKDFREKSENYIKKLSGENIKSGLIIYLDENGNLWHGDKNQHCYPMSTRGYRMKIIKFLVENRGVQSTNFIASSLEKKEQNIRSEIGKIRAKIKSLLKLDDVIENKQNGYRINPKYKIIFTKD